MQIARSQGWKMWGAKGYWDVLETVWNLNKKLPSDKQKMRVVGISWNWDGPSMALAGLSEYNIKIPLWERLRLIRPLCSGDLGLMCVADEIYARNIEKEIIEKNERGIVWVGSAHSSINHLWRGVSRRMGYMLHQKYGDRIFQIRIHDTSYGYPVIFNFIEDVMNKRNKKPVGFFVNQSPFASLRDESDFFFKYQKDVCFSDIASGYLYLKPIHEQERCQWLDGYISEKMFTENQPFYEGKIGHKLNDSKEANKAFGIYQGW
jgi:hypothetical protein